MSVLLVGAMFVWLATAAGAALFRRTLLLRLHGAAPVARDQAPAAHALLLDLSSRWGIACPRLFVIAAEQPNGFAVKGLLSSAIAMTEGVFERLGPGELRGLLAVLTARLADRRAARESTVAALALAASPFHPAHWRLVAPPVEPGDREVYRTGPVMAALAVPALALVRAGFPGGRWLETDRAAARLVGSDLVVAALEALESGRADAAGGRPLSAAPATASLFCRRPAAAERAFDGLFATQPSFGERSARLRVLSGGDQVIAGVLGEGVRPQR